MLRPVLTSARVVRGATACRGAWRGGMVRGFATTRRCPSEAPRLAATELTDVERDLSDMVSRLARERIAPIARRMDEEEAMDADVIKALFENGLMGIEVPETY